MGSGAEVFDVAASRRAQGIRGARWAVAACPVLLAGCLFFGDDPEDPALRMTTAVSAEVIVHETPTATVPGRLVTLLTDADCHGDSLYRDSTLDTTRYAVGGGRLQYWDEGDCLAMDFAGTGDGFTGTWTSAGLDAFVPVPAPYGPVPCRDDEEEEEEPPFDVLQAFRFHSVAMSLDGNRLRTSIDASHCPAEIFAASDDVGSDVRVTSRGCSRLKLRNTAAKTSATITFSLRDERSMEMAFLSGGERCAIRIHFEDPADEAACRDRGLEYVSWLFCALGSGFYGDVTARPAADAAALRSGDPLLALPERARALWRESASRGGITRAR